MYFYIYYFFSDSSDRSGWDGKCSEARELLQGKTLITHDCIKIQVIYGQALKAYKKYSRLGGARVAQW